jgi:hypothetical protein
MARVIAPILTGQTLGKWVVGAMFKHPVRNERMYKCVCECGVAKDVKHGHLFTGKTKSCGCSWTSHGMAKSKEYRIWDSMVRRCHSESHHAYSNYGGRGISVCNKWRKFEGFYEDMGNKPKGLTLERIDNSLGYNKDNCKWASMTEQSRNRRTTKLDKQDASLIKMMIDIGVTQNVIANQFNVSRANIGHIAQGLTWRNV